MRQSLSFCLLASFLVSPLLAADPKDGPVYTDPQNVDEDYHFQGEYRGYQRSQPSHRTSRPIGLQVIALGDGKFSAVKYYGGLPGAGWTGGERFLMSGERTGDIVQLHGDNYEIVVDGNGGAIFAQDGREAGMLQKQYRVSPTMGASPPPRAKVLFDGTSTEWFKNAKMTPDGLLMAGTETVEAYDNFRLHGEFRLPYKPFARGQGRGNSGFYLQSRYEVQVLDSFGLEGVENECGALYKTRRPDFNMCLPPLQWQTYDIDITSPKFDENGNKVENMRISVWHNGVLIHNNAEIPHKTGAGKKEEPFPLPTKLQDHGNPVVYRNIWVIEKSTDDIGRGWVHVPHKIPPVPVSMYQLPQPIPVYGVTTANCCR